MSEFSHEKINLFKEIFSVLTRNLWIKILSIIFAIFLFFIARIDKEIIIERIEKIEFDSNKTENLIKKPHDTHIKLGH